MFPDLFYADLSDFGGKRFQQVVLERRKHFGRPKTQLAMFV